MKQGLFEIAHRGTLFLDEIGDADPQIQPKLLKVVEEQRFRRLGDVRDRQVDVRLIAASHHDLKSMVGETAATGGRPHTHAGGVGSVSYPARVRESYAQDLLDSGSIQFTTSFPSTTTEMCGPCAITSILNQVLGLTFAVDGTMVVA